MKKMIRFVLILIIGLHSVGCNPQKENIHIEFPFSVESVEKIEMYHHSHDSSSAEKKVITAEEDIKTLYDAFQNLSLTNRKIRNRSNADTTSFRFHFSDGTAYELIYSCYGVKKGILTIPSDGIEYFTNADIGSYWSNLNQDLEAISVEQSELPK